ncbi:hypothetical protein DFH09DRAFT_1325869 [Mycena vulgaris]|nr:hypothetical protein DFH09DRAFT_1325869 [Mycena vulgaris]
MQFSKLIQLLKMALGTLHAAAGPLIPFAVNTTENSLQIDPNTNIGSSLADGSTLAWGAGDNRCLATIVQIDVCPPSFIDMPALTATKSGNFCDITFRWRSSFMTRVFGSLRSPSWTLWVLFPTLPSLTLPCSKVLTR